MSLDVSLIIPGTSGPERWVILIREDGGNKEISLDEWNKKNPGIKPILCQVGGKEEVFAANITHNLGVMAEAAGIYKHLWRPEELGITTAEQLIEPLRAGLLKLKADPDKYRALNPENGWGNYDNLVAFVKIYLDACEEYSMALVKADR